MITWMLYSALVALVVAVAARAAESLVRLSGYRIRWIWAGALALTTYLSASAALRGLLPASLAIVSSATIDLEEVAPVQTKATWRVRIDDLRHSLDAPL